MTTPQQAAGWPQYAGLLQRAVAKQADASNPPSAVTDGLTKTDAEKLTTLMQRLGVSAEQALADRRLVAEARALQADFDSCLASMQEAREADERLKQFDQKTDAERRELETARDDARRASHRRGHAAQTLSSLSHSRPELFDDGDPPRLIAD